MNTFSSAYKSSKKDVLNEQKVLIDKQKNDVVNAIKKEYGITSFASMSESEKKSYKTMVLEMWNPETGLTRKGEKFLFESRTILTADSTEEQVEKYFKKAVLAQVKEVVAGHISNDVLKESVKKAKAEMEEMRGAKISVKSVKTWLLHMVCEEYAKVIRKFELN